MKHFNTGDLIAPANQKESVLHDAHVTAYKRHHGIHDSHVQCWETHKLALANHPSDESEKGRI